MLFLFGFNIVMMDDDKFIFSGFQRVSWCFRRLYVYITLAIVQRVVSSVFHALKVLSVIIIHHLNCCYMIPMLHTLQNIIVNVGTTFGKVGKYVTGLIKP